MRIMREKYLGLDRPVDIGRGKISIAGLILGVITVFFLIFMLYGVAFGQEDEPDDVYRAPAPTRVYNIYNTYIVNPYPDYEYNPCVGCSPWMTEHSYPASDWDEEHGAKEDEDDSDDN